ncbi:MAG: UDP-N-acetylglucosamine 2-epimerase (hydrolyzing) [Planctomycetaceae bacterium]|nr:UDP-N-acetylglucosamine 2-epimerase (hydrolyzing) [Planctomycetaceae bacterium]
MDTKPTAESEKPVERLQISQESGLRQRTIAVVTAGRSDWGIYLPILHEIRRRPELRLHVIATGSHLLDSHGSTLNDLTRDGFPADNTVDMLLAGDSPEAIAKSMGLATIGFAQLFAQKRPDLLLVLGDRFEMHASTVAATPFRIPIAHIHGGEVTQGAIDDAYRHAITKYSHLHFASTLQHADRIVRLGEEPWRVTNCGAPALDNLKTVELQTKAELEERLGLSFETSPMLVTFHPVTLQYEQAAEQIDAVLQALTEFPHPMVITRPNADTRNLLILERLEAFAAQRDNVLLVQSLGTRGYFGMMKIAAAMVGNSSSGIIEAASFGLPVVNIGLRQEGRPRSANVIDVDCVTADIRAAIRQALSDEFRDSLQDLTNIYGNGTAARQIVDRLSAVAINDELLIKRFFDGERNTEKTSQRTAA